MKGKRNRRVPKAFEIKVLPHFSTLLFIDFCRKKIETKVKNPKRTERGRDRMEMGRAHQPWQEDQPIITAVRKELAGCLHPFQ